MKSLHCDILRITRRLEASLPASLKSSSFNQYTELEQLQHLEGVSLEECVPCTSLLAAALGSQFSRVATLAVEITVADKFSHSANKFEDTLLRGLVLNEISCSGVQSALIRTVLIQHCSGDIDEFLIKVIKECRSLTAQAHLITLLFERYRYFRDTTSIDCGRIVRLKGIKRIISRRKMSAAYYTMVYSVISRLELTEDIWVQGAARVLTRRSGFIAVVRSIYHQMFTGSSRLDASRYTLAEQLLHAAP